MIDSEILPTIETGRVRLRWLTDADVPALFRVFSDPEVMQYWSSLPMREPSEATALLDQIHQCHRDKSLFQWGVALRDNDRVVGTTTLAHVDRRNRRAEIGYALDRAQWGKGLMTEALTALFDYAFGDLSLHRIEADVDPRNGPSIGLLERLGFRREGYMRERWLTGGVPQDSLMFGLLGREWQERPGAASRTDRADVS